MSDTGAGVADRAQGSFDPDLLTDKTLLGKKSVLQCLDADEQVQYLFVNENRGLFRYNLKKPDVEDDFTTAEGVELSPEQNYAAVLVVTDSRFVCLIGQKNGFSRVSVEFENITAVRSKTDKGVTSIAVRTSTQKLLFTPEGADDIDAAVRYIRHQIGNPKSDSSAEPTYKYSTTSRGTDSDSNPSDGERGSSDSSSVSESSSDPEQSPEDWDWVGNEVRNSQDGDSGPPPEAGTTNEVETSEEFVSERGESESTPKSGSRHGADDVDADEQGTPVEDDVTEAANSRLPSEVSSHVEASREALDGIKSPFTAPDKAYAASIKAYSDLCQALDAIPPNEFDDHRSKITLQLGELEVLIELLAKYNSTLTTATALVEQSTDEGETNTLEGTPDREELAEELAELESAATELSIDTKPIQELRTKLTDAAEVLVDEQISTVGQPSPRFNEQATDNSESTRSSEALFASNTEATTGDSTPDSDEGGVAKPDSNSVESERVERVVHHLFFEADSSRPTETREDIYELCDTLDSFDIRTAPLTDAEETLETLYSKIETVARDDGVESPYLQWIRTRVDDQRESVDRMTDILVGTRRRVRIGAGEHTSVPSEELVELRERLSTGAALAESLGRDTTRFQTTIDEVDELLEETDPQPTTDVTDHDSGSPDDRSSDGQSVDSSTYTSPRPTTDAAETSATPPVDPDSGIQANEVSEWYDAVQNLRQVTAAIQGTVDELDAPMDNWCKTVKQFVTSGREDHPPYGAMQRDQNEFSMSKYREVYGNGERTTTFHTMDVEPLSATVKTLLDSVVDQPLEDVYLPIAPDSGVRLPVIVETETEFERAVGLLDELPTTLTPANGTAAEEGTAVGPMNPEPTAGSEGNHDSATQTETRERDLDAPNGPTENTEDDDDDDDEPIEEADTAAESALTDIGGVTPDVAESLRRAGITTREQLVATEMDELAEIDGVGMDLALRIKMNTG